MARLPDELVDRLQAGVSLVRLLESQGHTLKKHGLTSPAISPTGSKHESPWTLLGQQPDGAIF